MIYNIYLALRGEDTYVHKQRYLYFTYVLLGCYNDYFLSVNICLIHSIGILKKIK